MKRFTWIFWLGIAMYVLSFYLVATSGPGSTLQHPNPQRGYSCAWWALVVPWVFIDDWPQGVLPILMPFLAASGWINLLFVSSVLALWRQKRRLFSVLRILVLLTLPTCWVVFYFGVHPREGYVVWTIAMLLVLFSPSAQTSASPPSLFPRRT
jgi:hypothetical protein